MRKALLLAAVVATGCGTESPTSDNSSQPAPWTPPAPAASPPVVGNQQEVPPENPRDIREYTDELKKRIPVGIDRFTAADLKAEKYELNPYTNEGIFKTATVYVERVYLIDKVTGRGGWYTRARLVSNNANPNLMLGSWSHHWIAVEMLP